MGVLEVSFDPIFHSIITQRHEAQTSALFHGFSAKRVLRVKSHLIRLRWKNRVQSKKFYESVQIRIDVVVVVIATSEATLIGVTVTSGKSFLASLPPFLLLFRSNLTNKSLR